MTARATFTEAQITRAIRAADKAGKVALITRAGIAFVEPATVKLPSPPESGGNSCDEVFGVTRCG